MQSGNQENVIFIEICSQCKQHSWNTRHDENLYKSLAQEIKNSIQAQNSELEVFIVEMKGVHIGSFEIKCGKYVLFSKLKLKYFPHTKAVTQRIIEFFEDKKNSRNLQKYETSHGSPVKQRSFRPPSTAKYSSPVKTPNKPKRNQNQNKTSEKAQLKLDQAPSKQGEKIEKSKPEEPKKDEPKRIERNDVVVPQSVNVEMTTEGSGTKVQPNEASSKQQQETKNVEEEQQRIEEEKRKKEELIKKQEEEKERQRKQEEEKQRKKQQEDNKKKELQEKEKQQQKQQQELQQRQLKEKQQKQREQKKKEEQQAKQKQELQQRQKERLEKQQKQLQAKEKNKKDEEEKERLKVQQQKKKQSEEDKAEAQRAESQRKRKEQQEKSEKQKQEQMEKEAKKQEARQNFERLKKIEVELVEGQQKLTYPTFESNIQKSFNKFDKSENGFLEEKQIEDYVNQLTEDLQLPESTHKEFYKQFVQMADTNKDGKISLQELKRACWECLVEED